MKCNIPFQVRLSTLYYKELLSSCPLHINCVRMLKNRLIGWIRRCRKIFGPFCKYASQLSQKPFILAITHEAVISEASFAHLNIYHPQMKLREGNVFTSVCLSTSTGGGG